MANETPRQGTQVFFINHKAVREDPPCPVFCGFFC